MNCSFFFWKKGTIFFRCRRLPLISTDICDLFCHKYILYQILQTCCKTQCDSARCYWTTSPMIMFALKFRSLVSEMNYFSSSSSIHFETFVHISSSSLHFFFISTNIRYVRYRTFSVTRSIIFSKMISVLRTYGTVRYSLQKNCAFRFFFQIIVNIMMNMVPGTIPYCSGTLY